MFDTIVRRCSVINNITFHRPPIKGVEIKRCAFSEHSYKEHLHQELSIGLIEKGSTVVDFFGKSYSFKEGEGIVIPPYVSHICRPDDVSNWQVVMLYINPSYYEGEFESCQPRKLDDIELNKLMDFLHLLTEQQEAFEIENALIELLLTCVEKNEQENKYDQNITQIYEYIKEHFLEAITLESLQTHFYINKFTLIRGFKFFYNTTPSAFQLQLKVAYSKGLLSSGMNLLDVCSQSGFYDQAHFNREFKNAHGKTPLQYQRDVIHHS